MQSVCIKRESDAEGLRGKQKPTSHYITIHILIFYYYFIQQVNHFHWQNNSQRLNKQSQSRLKHTQH